MQHMQERVYSVSADYRRGSPHLTHLHLQDQLLQSLHSSLAELETRQLPPTVLEIGAGHGGFTQHMLAWGYRVTATEMSRPSIQRLQAWFGRNPDFKAVFDADGSLSTLGDARFSALVTVSVLHHIPDYVAAMGAAVRDHLAPGGNLITLQDPLWYPRQSRAARGIDRAAYFTWRVFQGRYLEGLSTRYRRFRNIYDDSETADNVEYHVVRQGVDEQKLRHLLAPSFERSHLFHYWSTNSRVWQVIGERLGLKNTFGLVATAYCGLLRNDGSASTMSGEA